MKIYSDERRKQKIDDFCDIEYDVIDIISDISPAPDETVAQMHSETTDSSMITKENGALPFVRRSASIQKTPSVFKSLTSCESNFSDPVSRPIVAEEIFAEPSRTFEKLGKLFQDRVAISQSENHTVY
jgi:hypothetical protein